MDDFCTLQQNKDPNGITPGGMGNYVASIAAGLTGAISFAYVLFCFHEHTDAGQAPITANMAYALKQIGFITGTGIAVSYVAGQIAGRKAFRGVDEQMFKTLERIDDVEGKYKEATPQSTCLKAIGFGLAAAALVAVVKTGYDRKHAAQEKPAAQKTAFVPPPYDPRTTYVLS